MYFFTTEDPDRVPELLVEAVKQLALKGARNAERQPVHAFEKLPPEYVPLELNHVRLEMPVPQTDERWAEVTAPNLPWAEDHFWERVGGLPLNPAPSHEWWPFARGSNKDHVDANGQFSHTYPERFWPKHAGGQFDNDPMTGLRFDYGDLSDLIELLRESPHTRQAYLPVWFPEDLTAARERQRVPCTLGYHFLLTPSGLDMEYHIRSCDAARFFADDIYMAGRLLQHVAWMMAAREDRHSSYRIGKLVVNIGNFHCFVGDVELANGPLQTQIGRWVAASSTIQDRTYPDIESDWEGGYV